MKIITNNQARDVVYAWQLTEKERAEFDYHDDINSPDCSASFFRYKGNVYDLGEFVCILSRSQQNNGYYNSFAHTCDDGDKLLQWHGIQSETYFSGVLVKYADEYCESVIIGRYFS